MRWYVSLSGTANGPWEEADVISLPTRSATLYKLNWRSGLQLRIYMRTARGSTRPL